MASKSTSRTVTGNSRTWSVLDLCSPGVPEEDDDDENDCGDLEYRYHDDEEEERSAFVPLARRKNRKKDAFTVLMSSPERSRRGVKKASPPVMPRTPVKRRRKKSVEDTKKSQASASTQRMRGSADASSSPGAAAAAAVAGGRSEGGTKRMRRSPFAPSPGRRRRHRRDNHHPNHLHGAGPHDEWSCGGVGDADADAEAGPPVDGGPLLPLGVSDDATMGRSPPSSAAPAVAVAAASSSARPSSPSHNSLRPLTADATTASTDAAVAQESSSASSSTTERRSHRRHRPPSSRFGGDDASGEDSDAGHDDNSADRAEHDDATPTAVQTAERAGDETRGGEAVTTAAAASAVTSSLRSSCGGGGGSSGGSPSRFVTCPICEGHYPIHSINEHVDSCLLMRGGEGGGESGTKRDGKDRGGRRRGDGDEGVSCGDGGRDDEDCVEVDDTTAASKKTTRTMTQAQPTGGRRCVTLDGSGAGHDDLESASRRHECGDGDDGGAAGESDDDEDDDDGIDLDAPAFGRGRDRRRDQPPPSGAARGGGHVAGSGSGIGSKPGMIGDGGRRGEASSLTKSLASRWGFGTGTGTTHAGGGTDRRASHGTGGGGGRPSLFSARLLQGISWPWTRTRIGKKRKRGEMTNATNEETSSSSTRRTKASSSSPEIITIDDSEDDECVPVGAVGSVEDHHPSPSEPCDGGGEDRGKKRSRRSSLLRSRPGSGEGGNNPTGGGTLIRRGRNVGDHCTRRHGGGAPVISLLDDDEEEQEEEGCSPVNDVVDGDDDRTKHSSRGFGGGSGSNGNLRARCQEVDRPYDRTKASAGGGGGGGGGGDVVVRADRHHHSRRRRKRSRRSVPSAEEVITIVDSSDEEYDSDLSDDRLLDAVLGTGTPPESKRARRRLTIDGTLRPDRGVRSSSTTTAASASASQTTTAPPPPTPEMVGRAVGYVSRVKRRLLASDRPQPEEYAKFLSVLRSYHQHSGQRDGGRRGCSRSSPVVAGSAMMGGGSVVMFEEVKSLFRRTGHADLLREFVECFCPPRGGGGDGGDDGVGGRGGGATILPPTADDGAQDAEDASSSERPTGTSKEAEGVVVPSAGDGDDVAEDGASRPCSPYAEEGVTASPPSCSSSPCRTREPVVALAPRPDGMTASSLVRMQPRNGTTRTEECIDGENDTCRGSTTTSAHGHLTMERLATEGSVDNVDMPSDEPANVSNDSGAAVATAEEAMAQLAGSNDEEGNYGEGTHGASKRLLPVAAAKSRTTTTMPGSPSLPSPTTTRRCDEEVASMEPPSSPCDDDVGSVDGVQFSDDCDGSEDCEESSSDDDDDDDGDSDYRLSSDDDRGDSDGGSGNTVASSTAAAKRLKKEVKVGRRPSKKPSPCPPKKKASSPSSASSRSRLALRGCGRLVWVREGQDGLCLHPAFILSSCDDDDDGDCETTKPKGTAKDDGNGNRHRMMKIRWASTGGIRLVPSSCIVWDIGRRRRRGRGGEVPPLDDRMKRYTPTPAPVAVASCSIEFSGTEEVAPPSDEPTTAPSVCSSSTTSIKSTTAAAAVVEPKRRRSLPRHFHPSLSNAVWRALNTSEPRNATSVLTEMACLYSTVPGPSSTLASGMRDILLEGPRGDMYVDNRHTYPDGDKVELVSRYAAVAVRKGLFPPRSPPKEPPTALASRKLCAVSGGVELSWKDIESSLNKAADANLVDDDDAACEGDTCSVEKTFNALQQASFALEYVLSGVASSLYGVVSPLGEVEPIEALKATARCAARCWMRNGRMLISEGGGSLSRQSQGMANCIVTSSACASAAMRCLSALGRLTCHVSHCFCLEREGKSVVGFSASTSAGVTSRTVTISPITLLECASICREVISGELKLSVYGAYSGVPDGEEEAARRKEGGKFLTLSFLSTLDVGTEFSDRFRFCLGQELGFSNELSIIA